MAPAIIRLCLLPGEARLVVHEAAVVHDPEHRAPRVDERGDICLRELLRIAPSASSTLKTGVGKRRD
jgi:hypothetical protein